MLEGYKGIKDFLGVSMQWVQQHQTLYQNAWVGNTPGRKRQMLFDKQKVINLTRAYIEACEYARTHEGIDSARALVLPDGSMILQFNDK